MKDSEVEALQIRLLWDKEKEPFDLTQKTLVRIFTHNSFKQRGRSTKTTTGM